VARRATTAKDIVPLRRSSKHGPQTITARTIGEKSGSIRVRISASAELFAAGNVIETTALELRSRRGQEQDMDWNRIEGNWKQAKGTVKEKWGQLTDDDLAQINGQRDQLEGKIQQRYGLAKDMVRKDVDDWLSAQK
jgi:uncharacterized protein YjbJ (UPF0337 family)